MNPELGTKLGLLPGLWPHQCLEGPGLRSWLSAHHPPGAGGHILILSSVPPVQILPPPHSQSIGSFLSELQSSQLPMDKQNLCLPRGLSAKAPSSSIHAFLLGVHPPDPPPRHSAWGSRAAPSFSLLPPLGWVFRLLLGPLMITMI